MLNMKAMPAARGAGLAAYLWKEAATLDAPEGWVAKSELDHLIEQGADFDELVDAAYAERLTRVQAAMPPPEHHHVLHGIEPGINHALIYEKANEDVWAVIERYEAAQDQRITGVEYRQDTAPELAALLGIDPVSPPRLKDLQHLLSAKAADGQQIAGRFYRTDRPDQMTMGSLCLILSADKSVSAAYALSSPDERRAFINAQRAAVDTTMRGIADKAGFIRSRRQGIDKHDPADLTWVQWQHHLSRSADPQLHTNITLLNVVRSRVDGKVGTLDTHLLNGHYWKFRETYHRALADELGKLGLAVEFDERVPAAVLKEVPKLVQRHFSGRTADAEKAAEKWLRDNRGVNFSELTPAQRSAWLTQMSARTRPPKGTYYVPGNGHAAWHARAAGQGYVPPPQFISPQALQRAGIAHVTVQQTTAPSISSAPSSQRSRQQSVHRKALNPRLDSRYNVGGGHYDEAPSQGRRI